MKLLYPQVEEFFATPQPSIPISTPRPTRWSR